jgi:hypothetical protein
MIQKMLKYGIVKDNRFIVAQKSNQTKKTHPQTTNAELEGDDE